MYIHNDVRPGFTKVLKDKLSIPFQLIELSQVSVEKETSHRFGQKNS